MQPVPILFLGDAPQLSTGLARIGRDLASNLSTVPQFRVGYMGRGGYGSTQLPFAQYHFPEHAQWGEAYLEAIWHDFAGDEPGIVFSIWDASRLHWFSSPNGTGGSLERFLSNPPFKKWGYFPVDSKGIGGRLTALSRDTLRHYDRILAYGKFGAGVIEASVGHPVEWIPHGINLDVFIPRERTSGRMSLGFREKDIVIGCVMANQARKDWGLAFSIIAELKRDRRNVKFWAHVDVMARYWDLRALAEDFEFGVQDITVTTADQFNDYELSHAYSACNLTILPSLGEGFGYPVVESMACGVPCITGNYGGAVELVPVPRWLVKPVIERLDTLHNCVRPVYDALDWVLTIEGVLQPGGPSVECRAEVEHLDWKKLWPSTWKKWFLEGVHVLP